MYIYIHTQLNIYIYVCVLLITHLNMFDKFKIVLQPPANQRLTHLQEALCAVSDELCRVFGSVLRAATNWSHRGKAQSSFLSCEIPSCLD